jgi:hypothetical protein
LSWDPIAPIKPNLGGQFHSLVGTLEEVIAQRYRCRRGQPRRTPPTSMLIGSLPQAKPFMLRRLRDAKLQQAAESVLAKLAVVVLEPLQPHLVSAPIYVSDGDAPAVTGVDPGALRAAIHDARKVAIA